MSNEVMYRGPLWGGLGAGSPFTATPSGAQRVADAHGRFMEAVLRGNTYYLSAAAAGPTAYVGASAGSPLLAIHNPANSKRIFQVLVVGFSQRAVATAAGQFGLNFWSGVSAQPTGTVTPARNAYSQQTTGSAALGFVNTALTGSTALNLSLPLHTHYWATAAGAISSPGFFDIGALLFCVPGNQVAIGVTTVPTTVTVDIAMYWEEILELQ